MQVKDCLKALLLLATMFSFMLNMEVLAWLCLLAWGMKGLWKFLLVLDNGGFFND